MSTIEYTSENVSYKFSRYRFLNIVRLSTFFILDIDAWKFALTSCQIACLCETHSLCSLHPDPGLKLLQISWQLLINGVFCTLGRTLCRFFINRFYFDCFHVIDETLDSWKQHRAARSRWRPLLYGGIGTTINICKRCWFPLAFAMVCKHLPPPFLCLMLQEV